MSWWCPGSRSRVVGNIAAPRATAPSASLVAGHSLWFIQIRILYRIIIIKILMIKVGLWFIYAMQWIIIRIDRPAGGHQPLTTLPGWWCGVWLMVISRFKNGKGTKEQPKNKKRECWLSKVSCNCKTNSPKNFHLNTACLVIQWNRISTVSGGLLLEHLGNFPYRNRSVVAAGNNNSILRSIRLE